MAINLSDIRLSGNEECAWDAVRSGLCFHDSRWLINIKRSHEFPLSAGLLSPCSVLTSHNFGKSEMGTTQATWLNGCGMP